MSLRYRDTLHAEMFMFYAICFLGSWCMFSFVGASLLQTLPYSNLIHWDVVKIFLLGYAFTYLDRAFKKDGYKWSWFQRLPIWEPVLAYFPAKIHVAKPLDHDKNYIFAAFPHGACTAQHLITMTNGCRMLSEVHRGERRDLAASVLFLIPLVRELLLWLGNVDAGASTAQYNLKKQRSLLIFVGGEAEQLMTTRSSHQVFLAKRKGFIKLAIQYGVPLVPVYCFGENDVYYVSSALLPLRKWLMQNFHIGIVPFWGRWGTWFPLKVPLDLVVGEPIAVIQQAREAITDETVDALHGKFCAALTALFDANKARFGCANASLKIT